METVLALCIGLGLSAACGFRVFVPMLGLSLAAHAGHVSLSPEFRWLATEPALIALGFGTALEIAAYYVPWLDHFLDTLSTPAAIAAGIMVTASMLTDMSPFLRWSLAVIAGGGVAATVQSATVAARAFSGLTTGGLGNPLIASVELGGSILTTFLSLIIPAGALLCLLACVGVVGVTLHRRQRNSSPS